ncbi:MAG: TonB-dependent receptor [Gammaproteobacteria bacterium]|nr:TonB-dependent receptor [Gammaproteobacteria bacterium]
MITRATVEYTSDNVHLSISLFNNDFDHLQGNCLGETDCDNSSINVGEANVKGAEIKLSTVWQVSNFELPIELAFTHNDGQYQRDFNRSSGGWQINRGDLLPYIPDNHLYFKIGLRARNWKVSAQATYRGVARTSPGANFNQANAILDDVALLNIQASYAVSNAGLITLAINNVTDEVYAQSSFQAGLLAGNERTVSLRYKYRF